MNLQKFLLLSCLMCAFGCTGTDKPEVINPVAYVDPYIGTGGHGHTFLGVTAPFGAVQIGPNNINKGWDWCSGYHYSDSIVIGFSHLHLNGTGCSDTGDILFMPYTGKARTQPGTQQDPLAGYASYYSKDNERALPGYYEVLLKTHRTKVELTASDRVAFHRYTFPKDVEKHVMINLKDANGDDRPTDTYLEQINDTVIRGYRYSTGWSKKQQIYFSAVFSQPVHLTLYHDSVQVAGNRLQGLDVKGNVAVAPVVEELGVKVGISPVSMENAMDNIGQEIKDWNFENIVAETTGKWNAELSKLQVETTDTVAKRIFYTALYHAFMQPIMFNDCSGEYRGTDKNIYGDPGFTNYTVFSLWDTYRAVHPLYTLVQPERVPDFINSMLAIYEQQGRLPVWHLYGSDTNEMIGIQSVPVIADAILKDVKGFNYERAYQAMKASMMSDYKGLSYVTDLEYIPADKENESVAKGLEYAIADWGVAQVARKLGKTEDYEYFSKRALAYQNYWDKDTHFFRGKNRDGSWVTPFNPVHSTHRNDAYCEGNGWQYTWLVPHDVEGLISLFGSKEAFVSKLDSLFLVNEDLGDAASPDISGLIGQYAHGNEPGHHTVYLYSFVGQQWKTAEKVDYILSHMYSDLPDGLQGNEDCGQMSSWYVFSALGFYPVNPSDGMYVFGRPIFDKVVLKLPENKVFEIRANNNSAENKYIQSIELNGQPYNKLYISHADIMAGGTLVFTMGNRPNEQFGMITQSSVETDIN
jgi:predicted alpha-1,2-mannosidase